MTIDRQRPRIGLALGSGAARGWAHIGVLRELLEMGVTPDVVCGTSSGAVVGAAYCRQRLDALEAWVRSLDAMDVARYLDISPRAGGGAIRGRRLIDGLRNTLGEAEVEALPVPFATVATQLNTGREVWLTQGDLLTAVRASISLPGLFSPMPWQDAWLVDGGLVNPVPVSLARGLGADIVIAVNLNSYTMYQAPPRQRQQTSSVLAQADAREGNLGLLERTSAFFGQLFDSTKEDKPGILEVLTGSIHIMQDRITRSRLAGDLPEVLISPRLQQIGFMEFNRAAEAIAEGRASVRRSWEALSACLELQAKEEL